MTFSFINYNKNLYVFSSIDSFYHNISVSLLFFNRLHSRAFTDHKKCEWFLFLFKFLVLLYDLISSRGLASTGCIPKVFLFQFSRSVQCQNSQKIKATRLLKQASVLTTIPQSAKEKRGINLELSQKPALNGWVLSWLIFWCNSCIRSKGEIVFLPAHIPSSHCGCEGGEAQQSFIFSFK